MTGTELNQNSLFHEILPFTHSLIQKNEIENPIVDCLCLFGSFFKNVVLEEQKVEQKIPMKHWQTHQTMNDEEVHMVNQSKVIHHHKMIWMRVEDLESEHQV